MNKKFSVTERRKKFRNVELTPGDRTTDTHSSKAANDQCVYSSETYARDSLTN